MKNILFFIDDLRNAGTQNHLYRVIANINREHYTPYVCTVMKEGELADRLRKELGVYVFNLNLKKLYHPSVLSSLWKSYLFVKKKNIHIIHTYLLCADILGVLTGKMANTPLIITTRREMGFWNKKAHIFAYKITNYFADIIVAVSKQVMEYSIEQERLPKNKIVCIANGVDTSVFSSDRKFSLTKTSLGIKKGDIVVGNVANLRPIKGYTDFIKAAKKVLDNIENVTFLIIGEGDQKQELLKLSHELGINDKILFLGRRTQVEDLLAIMDVFFLTSLSEGMSNSLLEAMSMGKPVVATEVGGNSELVEDGVNGFLVPVGSTEAMANSLITLLRDQGLVSNMGKQSRARVEKLFSSSAMIKNMEELYEAHFQKNKK